MKRSTRRFLGVLLAVTLLTVAVATLCPLCAQRGPVPTTASAPPAASVPTAALAPATAALQGTDLIAGPYVTQVSQTSAKVLWVARRGVADRLEMLPEPNVPPPKAETKTLPLTEVEAELRCAGLQGLPAGQRVRYRLTCGKDKVEGSFQTLLPTGSRKEFRFLVYGDTRSEPEMHRAVAEAMRGEKDELFFIHTGDYATSGDDWPYWPEEFFGPAADLLRQTAIFPIRGNHEGFGLYYRQLFDLPGDRLYYSFDCGNAHFVVLDQYGLEERGFLEPNRMDAMLHWLDKDLATAETKAEWLIAAYHEPTYNVGGHASSWGREDVLPILEKHGVDMVFAGHSHLYERFRPIGPKGKKPIIHVVTGGGGAPLYPEATSPLLEAGYGGLHYCSLRIKGNELEMTVKTPGGKQVDALKLVKTKGTYQKEIMDRALTTEEADR